MEIDLLHIILIVIVLVCGGFVFTLFKRIRKQEAQLRQFNRSLDAIDMDRLDARLNSHLFKNILNSIQSHAYQTYYTVDKLSSVLDYVLYDAEKKFVSPYEEMNFAKDYIDINKIKLSPLFDLKTKIIFQETEPYLHSKILAPLVCIDLIENAFKHADIQSEDAFISIMIELKNNIFSIAVSNKISPKPALYKSHGGIGSASFESKLKKIYGNRYFLERSAQQGIFNAYLKINLDHEQD